MICCALGAYGLPQKGQQPKKMNIHYIYNTTDAIKELAVIFICICAILTPVEALNNAAYFTMRSGGKTFITFLFDSVFLWVISIPVATVLVTYTDWGIVPVYAFCQSLNLIKSVIGIILVKKGIWIQNVVVHNSVAEE